MGEVAASAGGPGKGLTQGELAFVHVRDRIMSGVYQPGTRLSEQGIADELELSRTPVREALRRLSETGLVELVANQRAKVMGWSVDMLRDTFETRAILESEGARLAATRITTEALEELRLLMEEMEQRLDEGGVGARDEIARLNQDFHEAIMRASDQHQVMRLTANLRFQPRMVSGSDGSADDFRHRANHQHREIHRALAAGDPEWAEAAMRAHIYAARAASMCAHDVADMRDASRDTGA